MNFLRSGDHVSQFKDKLKTDVNHFRHRRWQLVALLEQLTGFWPCQGRQRQYFLQTLHFVVLLSIFLAVANKTRAFVEDADTDMIIECCLTMVSVLFLVIKLFLACALQKTRKRIYERITQHFELMTNPEEASVLAQCADRGFKYTIICMCTACLCVGIFDIVPIGRSFCNYFLHDELNFQLPFQMDYGFDHKKYWYVVGLDFFMFIYSGILIDLAFDLSFILQIHHVQALFKIVRLRLKKASELVTGEHEGESISEDTAEDSYSMISKAIDLHSQCLELVKLIERAYTVNWFLILLINTGWFTAGTHLAVLRWHDKLETFRNSFAFLLFLLHFYVIFSQGQRVIDSSSAVSYACYDCNWHCMPKKSCKLLNTMMIRTSIPCEITGAKLFPLSMETFSKMLKAGISYYSVFRA